MYISCAVCFQRIRLRCRKRGAIGARSEKTGEREEEKRRGRARVAVCCVMSEREWVIGGARGLDFDSGKGQKRRISPLK